MTSTHGKNTQLTCKFGYVLWNPAVVGHDDQADQTLKTTTVKGLNPGVVS